MTVEAAIGDAFDRLRALAGQSEADLPGYGRITSSANLISNGKAIAEVIGSPDNHETSVYSHPGDQYGLPFIPGSGWLNSAGHPAGQTCPHRPGSSRDAPSEVPAMSAQT